MHFDNLLMDKLHWEADIGKQQVIIEAQKRNAFERSDGDIICIRNNYIQCLRCYNHSLIFFALCCFSFFYSISDFADAVNGGWRTLAWL
jgi:hypothetical protein